MSNIIDYATLLDDAARNAKEVSQFDEEGRLSLDDAYAIQAASIQRRVERGERRVGVKMGFTSRAKMVQMGLSDVIWGRLTAGMQIEEGTAVDFSRFVHPRVEPEIAFVLKRPLTGDVTDPGDGGVELPRGPIDVRFEQVTFAYPGGPTVLYDVDLALAPRSRVAVVGRPVRARRRSRSCSPG